MGYTAYAKEKNYADPTKMAENFVNYIKTDDGKRRLNQGLSEAINMDSLQKQISTAMSSYMGQVHGCIYRCHFSGNQYTDDICYESGDHAACRWT